MHREERARVGIVGRNVDEDGARRPINPIISCEGCDDLGRSRRINRQVDHVPSARVVGKHAHRTRPAQFHTRAMGPPSGITRGAERGIILERFGIGCVAFVDRGREHRGDHARASLHAQLAQPYLMRVALSADEGGTQC